MQQNINSAHDNALYAAGKDRGHIYTYVSYKQNNYQPLKSSTERFLTQKKIRFSDSEREKANDERTKKIQVAERTFLQRGRRVTDSVGDIDTDFTNV